MNTKTEIEMVKMMLSNDTLVMRALIYMMGNQTPGEASGEYTYYINNIGFNKIDATFLTSLAKQALAKGTLSQKQLDYARKMLVKYHKQIYNYLAEEVEREANNVSSNPEN